jgi:hypothetical protein
MGRSRYVDCTNIKDLIGTCWVFRLKSAIPMMEKLTSSTRDDTSYLEPCLVVLNNAASYIILSPPFLFVQLC